MLRAELSEDEADASYGRHRAEKVTTSSKKHGNENLRPSKYPALMTGVRSLGSTSMKYHHFVFLRVCTAFSWS
jgi:hypothetical protein